MTISSTALPTGLSTAQTDGMPLFVAHNAMRGVVGEFEWHTGDRAGGAQTNFYDLDWPAANVYNGMPWVGSKSSGSGVTAYYLYGQIASTTIDVIFIKILATGSNGTSTCVIKLDDVADLSTAVTAATITAIPEHSRGLALLSTRYSGVTYVQIRITNNSASTTPPKIGEVFLGQRLSLSRKFSTPYDDQPYGVDDRMWLARGQGAYHYVRAEGFRDFRGAYPLGSATGGTYSLSDETTVRDLYADSAFATRPVLFVPRPDVATSAFPHEAHIGHLDPSLRTPREGMFARTWDFSFEEQPPFYGTETGYGH